jgi:Protein of unknown function (DUF4238)
VSEPRKHHLVAQLYQRGFAKKKGKSFQVLVLDKATAKGGLRNVQNTFAERDWNTIEDAAGTKEFGVEKLLADHVDALAAPALQAMRDGRFPLDSGDREAMAVFMAAQLNRGRATRQNLSEFLVEVSHLILRQAAISYTDEQWLDAIGEVPSQEQREQIADSEKHFKPQPSNAMLLKTLLSSVDEIAELLHKRTWTLARFASGCLFTGEHPVVEINPSGESAGSGVMTAERIYMPVSATLALVLSHPWTNWPEAVVNGTMGLAVRLNWAMLSHLSNTELLLDPNVPAHPLPSPALLATGKWWPWGKDPESEPPVFLHYLPHRPTPNRASLRDDAHGQSLLSVGGAWGALTQPATARNAV